MPIDIVEDDEFTEPVSVPEPGDDRDASSVVQAFQPLTNRTRNLKNRIDDYHEQDLTFEGAVVFNWEAYFTGVFQATSDLVFNDATSEVLYQPERTKGVACEPPFNAEWVYDATLARSSCSTNNAVVPVKLPVPPGCTLTKVIATVSHGVATAGAAVFIRRRNAGTTAGAAGTPSASNLANASHSTSAGVEGIQVTLSALANQTSYFEALIVASDTAASSANHLYSLYYEFTDVGPRNGA